MDREVGYFSVCYSALLFEQGTLKIEGITTHKFVYTRY